MNCPACGSTDINTTPVEGLSGMAGCRLCHRPFYPGEVKWLAGEIERLRARNEVLAGFARDYLEWLDETGETGDPQWDARYRARRRAIVRALAPLPAAGGKEGQP